MCYIPVTWKDVASEMLTIEIKLQNRKYLFSTASFTASNIVSKMLQQPQQNNKKLKLDSAAVKLKIRS